MGGTTPSTTEASLSVEFVPDLASVLPVVEEYLSDRSGRDLFERDHIIVPNAGVKAWLLQQIADRIGCTSRPDGTSRRDGVAMNIEVGYIGALDSFLGRERGSDDRWDIDHLTLAVLRVISANDPMFSDQVARLGGGLKAARVIADRFDRYAARRPAMVEEWEKGNPVLSPEVGDAVGDPEHVGEYMLRLPPLAAEDMWQFHLWRRVRDVIGCEPWPVIVRRVMASEHLDAGGPFPSRLLVAGLQSLSVRHIQVLRALARRIPVRVVMVHPSPAMAARWVPTSVPFTPGVAPSRDPDEPFDDTVDQLVESWLRSAREMQTLFGSQGVNCILGPVSGRGVPDTLLDRIKDTVLTGSAPTAEFDDTDMSLRIHRAHNLARQVEVVRDAVLHALVDLDGLEPHEVVIQCADISTAAPLVKSAFAKEYVIDGRPRRVPVVVADRSLRQIDTGSQLLADLVRTVRGRFPVSDVLTVATSPLVMRHFRTGPDDVAAWHRFVDGAAVRWGLDADQRTRRGISAKVSAHTWALMIERVLLGAVLDDGEPRPAIGGVVPLENLDGSDIHPLSILARIVRVLSDLESALAAGERTITEWITVVENALGELCDPATGDLDDALAALWSMSVAVGDGVDDIPVRFDHLADLLVEILEEAPGRQPLRTGAVTVTSMVPLRGVPFRVVCLVGFDEGTTAAGDVEGDDLAERQRFVGDIDPRLDGRRAILDAVCAAADRVIITCNGRNIKDNKELPLITPLAELVDLCVRCGVTVNEGIAQIEHSHPRHFLSHRNFQPGGVVPGVVWSHDDATLAALAGTTGPVGAMSGGASSIPGLPIEIPFARLERLRRDPLRTFLNDGLRIDTWRDALEVESATVPLEIDKARIDALVHDLLAARLSGMTDATWTTMQETIGRVPIGLYKDPVVDHVTAVVDSLEAIALGWGFALDAVETLKISVPVGAGALTGTVTVHRTVENHLVFDPFLNGARELSVEAAALALMCLRASGEVFDGALVLSHDHKAQRAQVRYVELDSSLTAAVSTARVARLIGLLQRAEIAAFPNFGKTSSLLDDPDPSVSLDAFEKHLGDDSYPSGLEALLYGPRPRFDDVYPDNGPERAYFADYFDAMVRRDTEGGKAKGSVVPPNKSKTARTLTTRYVFG